MRLLTLLQHPAILLTFPPPHITLTKSICVLEVKGRSLPTQHTSSYLLINRSPHLEQFASSVAERLRVRFELDAFINGWLPGLSPVGRTRRTAVRLPIRKRLSESDYGYLKLFPTSRFWLDKSFKTGRTGSEVVKEWEKQLRHTWYLTSYFTGSFRKYWNCSRKITNIRMHKNGSGTVTETE